MREGETVAGIELLKIHPDKGRVTIRHLGSTNEISLKPAAHGAPTIMSEENSSEIEKRKDISHSEHHKLRARLDRKRDELQSTAAGGD